MRFHSSLLIVFTSTPRTSTPICGPKRRISSIASSLRARSARILRMWPVNTREAGLTNGDCAARPRSRGIPWGSVFERAVDFLQEPGALFETADIRGDLGDQL